MTKTLARNLLTLTALAGLMSWAAATSASAAVGDRIPYQENKSNICANAGICSVDFAVVPASRRMEINSVSCSIFTSGGFSAPTVVAMNFAVLNAAGNIILTDFAVPVRLGTNTFGATSAVNNQTFFFVPPGGKVRAVMITTTPSGLDFSCKIAGARVVLQ